VTKKLKLRLFKDKFYFILLLILSLIPIFLFILIIIHIIKKGITVIDWSFLSQLPKPVGEEGGGILNAIVGTILLIILASILTIPIGIVTGIFLYEYSNSKLAYIVRIISEIIQGIPSIVIGILAYIWVVKPMGHFSGLSGGVALALIMLPIVIKTTEEMLKLIPNELKEASLALGTPYYRTIFKVMIPTAISGILTGILTGIARIAGETAPLLFTAFGNPFLNFDIFKPISSLPHIIYLYSISPFEDWNQKAWGASFILLIFVLFLNVLIRILSVKKK